MEKEFIKKCWSPACRKMGVMQRYIWPFFMLNPKFAPSLIRTMGLSWVIPYWIRD